MLTAFENVATALHALEQDADALESAAAARDAAKVTLDLTTKQMQVGYVSYLTLLSSEQAYQQALITLVHGTVESLRRHRCAISGSRWWLVESAGRA